jgi:hypothetical protein
MPLHCSSPKFGRRSSRKILVSTPLIRRDRGKSHAEREDLAGAIAVAAGVDRGRSGQRPRLQVAKWSLDFICVPAVDRDGFDPVNRAQPISSLN